MCFILSECLQAINSGLSHQQLVSEPRSSKTEKFLGYIRIFKFVKNKFWSFHSEEIFNKNSSVQKSTQSELGVSHTLPLKIWHYSPLLSTRPEEEDDWPSRAPYSSR